MPRGMGYDSLVCRAGDDGGFSQQTGIGDGWLATSVGSAIDHLGVHWSVATLLLILLYVYSHYFFASTTAHITAMFAAFFAAGLGLGAPPALLGLMLGFSSSLMMSLTHYGTVLRLLSLVRAMSRWRSGGKRAGDECGQPDHLGCDRRLLVALVGILVVNTAGGGLLPP